MVITEIVNATDAAGSAERQSMDFHGQAICVLQHAVTSLDHVCPSLVGIDAWNALLISRNALRRDCI